MRFETFIAKRYLFKGRKNSFISTISLVSIIGIAIGVAAMIIALALINGFQRDIRGKILESTAHIMLNNIIGDGIDGYKEIMKKVKNDFPEVTDISAVVFGTVLLKGTYSSGSGAILRGIDFTGKPKENWLTTLKSGRLPVKKNEIVIGKDMAERMGLFTGDRCLIIAPRTVLSPTGLIPRIKRFTISGIFDSGLYEMDNGTIISNLKSGQKLFGLKNKINYIQLYVKDMFKVDETAKKLKKLIPPRLSVITWKDQNASLYSALDLEKTVLFFTLSLIIVVASLNIIAGLILLVIQKTKDIGILLSYGASSKTIRKIFFIQGSFIGIAGTFFGTVLGLGFSAIANKLELIKVPREIYQMSHITFSIKPFDLGMVILVSLLISFTATLIPSKKAANINIVDAVKNE